MSCSQCLNNTVSCANCTTLGGHENGRVDIVSGHRLDVNRGLYVPTDQHPDSYADISSIRVINSSSLDGYYAIPRLSTSMFSSMFSSSYFNTPSGQPTREQEMSYELMMLDREVGGTVFKEHTKKPRKRIRSLKRILNRLYRKTASYNETIGELQEKLMPSKEEYAALRDSGLTQDEIKNVQLNKLRRAMKMKAMI
jgi:hypothetical protein